MRAICRPAAIGELDDKLIILYVQWKRKEGIEMRSVHTERETSISFRMETPEGIWPPIIQL